jgi:hypothetical protein
MRILRRLRGERGLALPMALGMLFVLTISTTAAVYYTTTNTRSADFSRGKYTALTLAEAGLNNTMAVLTLPTNNSLKQEILPKCTGSPPPAPRRDDYAGGYVQYCGDLDLATSSWTIKSTGYVRNPNNATEIRRKLSAYVVVTPTLTQPLNNPAWNYVFSTRTGNTCDQTLNNNVSGGSRLYTNGNLCLGNNVNISMNALVVQGKLDLANGASVGASTSMSTRVETYVGQSCKYGNAGAWVTPCSGDQDSRSIFSKMNPPSYIVGVNGTPPVIPIPATDYPGWYSNALPGPYQSCVTVSGTPPTFETNYPNRDNNVPVQNLTPASSYTCRVGPAANPDGEISWDATSRVLTVRGTIYIDGSAKIDNNVVNEYNGQATLYLSGTFYLNGQLCGAVSGGACDFGAWNPNTEMLTVVANGNGGNGVNGDDSVFINNGAKFQGAIYATNNITLGNNAQVDGPMVASQIIVSNNVITSSFPNITTVPVGMPGNPAVYAQPNPPQRFAG